MELIRQIKESFLQVAENVLNSLEGEFNYSEFQLKLKDSQEDLGRKICQDVLQSADELICKNRAEREGWHIERRDDEKSILSPFGVVLLPGRIHKASATKRIRRQRISSKAESMTLPSILSFTGRTKRTIGPTPRCGRK